MPPHQNSCPLNQTFLQDYLLLPLGTSHSPHTLVGNKESLAALIYEPSILPKHQEPKIFTTSH